MNASKIILVAVGTTLAFALVAAPAPKKAQLAVVGAQPTPYSIDHARIHVPAEELPAQF